VRAVLVSAAALLAVGATVLLAHERIQNVREFTFLDN